jgi:ADP-heptose:LPS heptosyltransferase
VTSPIGGADESGQPVMPDVLTHHVFCRPCMLRECPIDHRCMKGVTVDAVVAAVTRRLAAARLAQEAAP